MKGYWLFPILLITFIFGIEVGMFTINYMLYLIAQEKVIDIVLVTPTYYGGLTTLIAPGVVAGMFTVALLVRHFLQGKRDIFQPLIPKLPESVSAVLTLLIIYIVTGLTISGYFQGLGKFFEESIVKPFSDLMKYVFGTIGTVIGLAYNTSIGFGSVIAILVYIFLTPWLAKIVDKLPYRFFTNAVIAIVLTLPITLPCAIACKEVIYAFAGLGIHMFFMLFTMMILGIAAVMDIRKMITKSDWVIHTAPVLSISFHSCKWLWEHGYIGFSDVFIIGISLLTIVYTIVATWAILADRKTLFTRTSIAIASICFTPILT